MAICILRILATTVLAYLFVEINARPEGAIAKHNSVEDFKPVVPDPNAIQEMKRFKLEVLKSKILNEIHLTEPPVVQTPVHLPRNMLKLLDKNYEEETASEEGEELIVYPYNEDFGCVEANDTACSRFEFELLLENRTVTSIHMWFHKVNLQEPLFIAVGFCTAVDDEETRTCDTHEVLSEAKTEFGWTIFEVPARLALISQNENRFCSVEAYGSNFEILGDRKPFLVATTQSATSERKRRSTRIVPGKVCTKECCKIDFYISFKEIGWHFVVAPAGFHANMCYGKCSNDQLNAFPSHYHRTMNLALANKTTTVEKKEHAWTPCCSPTNLKPLSMIYKAANDTNTNSTHTLVHHEIPDMIAESCGCW